MSEKNLQSAYIKMGIIMSIIAAITYPLHYYWNPEIKIELAIVLLFSLSIAISSVGIYHFLSLHTKRPCLEIGLKLNVLAALIFAIAGSVKLAMETPLEGILIQGNQSLLYALTDRIFMSLSFLWKMLFGFGLILLAVPAFSHPRTGKIIPSLGVLFGLSMLAVNFYSFPFAPEEINMVALGPLVPLWHLLVALIILLSGNWVREKLSEE
ncbi:MAG: hypothetical protein K9H49_17420 [Bacteroidales bacterium]|nr:hypothetical protein [Bacteroidales bacterium]MCF8390198.1 hypothetical protein [Bacteroidales bacterium]